MNDLLRILHLEDDPADVRLIGDTLREDLPHFEITVVTGRAEYLAALERTDFQLLLADYRLPGFDGLEALVLWRAHWPDKPFLFVTGTMGEDLAVEALKRGATDYILKGNLARLVPAIHRAVDEAETYAKQQRAETALRQSEERFRSMADNSHFLMWLTGPDKRCTWVNRGWENFVGRPLERELGNGWTEHIHPEDWQRRLEAYSSAFDARVPFRIEYRLRRRDGAWRWVLDKGGPLYGADRQFTGFIGTCIDLTEQKLAEETLKNSLREKEVLLREVHHRVKNNLQVISSLVNLQADISTGQPQRDILQDVCDRVRAIALVHEKLYQSETLAYINFAEYTQSLLDHVWGVHGRAADGINLVMDLQPVTMTVDQALPCGLLLNEVAGNALKHAFIGRAYGQVAVSLGYGPDGQVHLNIADDGVGLPTDLNWEQSPTLGLQLVQMLAGQINGTVAVRSHSGTEIDLRFPPLSNPVDAKLSPAPSMRSL